MAGKSDLTNIPRRPGRPRAGAAKRPRTSTGRRAPDSDPKAEPTLQRQTELLTAVRKAQSLYASRHDPQDVFRQLLHVLVSATGSRVGFLSEVHYDVDGNPYRSSLAVSDMPWDEDARRLYRDLASQNQEFRNLNTLAGAPVLERRVIIANEAARHPQATGLPKGHPPIDCFIGIPLFFGDDLIGLAGLANRPGGYSLQDSEFIEPLTSACANLIWAQRMLREEKESDAALRESQERYRRIVETANEGIWALDGDYRTTYVNRRMADMLGYAPEEMIGRRLNAFMFAEESKDHAEKVAFRQKGQGGVCECRFRRKDSGTLWAIVSETELKDGKDGFAGSFAMFTDIAERKAAEEDLLIYQKMITSSFDGICLVGRDYRYKAANETYLSRVGRTLEELRGRPVAEILGQEFFDNAISLRLNRCFAGEVVTYSEWFDYPAKGRLFVEVTLSPYQSNGSEVLGAVVVARDITDRKLREEIIGARLRLSEAAGTLTMDELLRHSLDEAERITSSCTGFLHFVEEDQKTMSLQMWSTNTQPKMRTAEGKGLNCSVNEAGVWADCIREQRPVVHNDCAALPHRKGLSPGHPPDVRELVVPILCNGRVVAVLGVGNKPQAYDEKDVEAVSSLAHLAWDIVLRKKAEEQLRANEALLRTTMASIADGILVVDLNGRVLMASPPFNDLWGIPPQLSEKGRDEDLLHYVQDQLTDPDDFLAQVKHLYASDTDSLDTIWFKDGRVFERYSLPLMRKGKIAGRTWSFRDVTPRIRIEEALRENEERYRTLAEASPSSIEVVQNGKYAYVNSAWVRMLGFASSEEAIGTPMMECVAPEWRQLCAERMAEIDAGRTNPPAEFEMVRRDGCRIVIESVSAPITYQGRKAMIVIGHNVTGRKLAERTLAESQARLKQLYDAAPDGIILADAATGVIVDVNPAASQLIGKPPQEIIGLHFTQLFPPQLIEAAKAGFKEQLSLAPGKPLENWILRPDGRQIPVEITAMPVKLQDRTVLQGIFRDISKRKRYEEELKLSQTRLRNLYHELQAAREEERRNVAREIHDELGQSLTVLKIDLAWLKHRLAPDQDPLRGKLEDMDRIVDATLKTVQRVSAELRPGILDSLGLTATVEWFVRDFEKRTEIQCDLSIEPDEIEADQGLATDVFRILQEALTNVVRHARASRVRVRLRQAPDAIHLNVADNGTGISAEQASHSTSFGILGMRERAAVRGGEISIQGVPREGTSISVRMPLIERQA